MPSSVSLLEKLAFFLQVHSPTWGLLTMPPASYHLSSDVSLIHLDLAYSQWPQNKDHIIIAEDCRFIDFVQVHQLFFYFWVLYMHP